MNTFMTIQSFGAGSHFANQKVQERIQIIEENISTTKSTSSVYKINHADGSSDTFDLNEDCAKLIRFALDIAEETNGALNIALYPIIRMWGFTTGEYRIPSTEEIQNQLSNTDYKNIQIDNTESDIYGSSKITVAHGMEIDLGALGKGFAGDEAIKILRQNGIKSALLDLGGNIQALGVKTDGSEWTIGIKNPWDGSVAAALKINNQAVVTSGGYERFFMGEDGKKYIHIFNGKTGYPVENEIAGVTIVTESGLYADALSTAMFVMGTEAACEYWKDHKNFEMIIFTDGQQMIYTSGLKNKLSPLYDFTEITVMD